ncbi:MAG: DUF1566 domain-containing protein, partial [Bacteroidales bacterium]|nr:DUF1566 domain-containing protein [Bacteroidales bacterium]
TDASVLTAQLIIQDDGNVGIGKLTPNTKLDVNGSVKSDTIFAKHDWNSIYSTPASLAGYGITDALQWADTNNQLATDYDVSKKQNISDTSTVDASRYWVQQQNYYNTIKINDLTDGKSDSSSVFLGSGAGINDDGSDNKNVAVGLDALNSNTSGQLNSACGFKALSSNISGNRNTATGFKALSSNTIGNRNTANGHKSLNSNTKGSQNTATGYNALKLNTKGDWNTANGSYALTSNTEGYDNTAIGWGALYENTEGYENIATGTYALYENMTGSYNTATGFDALGYNITGDDNTATGWSDLNLNEDGYENVATGSLALASNLTGDNNTANGAYALLGNTSGNNNTANGAYANFYNEEGSNNTIIGYEAGMGTAPHNKSGNVFIGYQAGFYETDDNNLYIENSSGTPLIYGNFDSDILRINGTLQISSEYHFPVIDGSSGQVLRTDGFGNLTWTNAAAGMAAEINDLNDAIADATCVFLGAGSGASHSTDASNTAVGIDALKNTVFDHNTAIGYKSMMFNDNGSGNTAIGSLSLGGNVDGAMNTATGFMALAYGASGEKNCAYGAWAAYNIGDGGGDENTTLGYNADLNNHGGSFNTIIGTEAGMGTGVHTKHGNVFLGYQAGYHEHGSNKLYIQNDNSYLPLIYGDFTTDLLRINGTLHIKDKYHFPTTDGSNGQVLETDGSGALNWGNKNTKYSIGDFAQGGIVFWVDESGEHGLVCAKQDQSSGLRWYAGTVGSTRAYGDGPFSGEMNTSIIIAAQVAIGDDGATYAARVCAEHQATEGGKTYGDWYLPSKEELNKMYLNKTSINSTALSNSGAALSTVTYWSSTEHNGANAFQQSFFNGNQLYAGKVDSYPYVRAIRAF